MAKRKTTPIAAAPEGGKVVFTCCACATVKEMTKRAKDQPPRGWKRKPNGTFCPTCWGARYRHVSHEYTLAKPLGAEWDELRDALKRQRVMFRALCNWAVRQQYLADSLPQTPGEVMPKFKAAYLYPAAVAMFPELNTSSLASTLQFVAQTYCRRRFGLWMGDVSLPNYRKSPIRISPQSIKLEWDEDYPAVSLPIGKKRFRLALKCGAPHRGLRQQFGRMVSGEIQLIESQILFRPAGESKTKGGQMKTRGKNGQRINEDIVIKLVGWQPVEAKAARVPKSLFVRTDKESFLIAVNTEAEKLWIHNADQLPRWVAEHRRQLQRWSEDQKAEQRPIAAFDARRTAACDRQNNRLKSFRQMAAAQLVQFAKRYRYSGIRLDDREHGFVDSFPWFEFREHLKNKCAAEGLDFIHVNASDEQAA